MADRVRRFPARTGPKRVTQWIGSADAGPVGVSTGASQILQSNATMANTTIIRVRGLLSVGVQAFTTDVEFQGAFGIGLVSDQAFAAGAASIPGSWTDLDWSGWFVWMAWDGRFEFLDATGVVGPAANKMQYVIDSKAMRKVAPNETLVVMAESQAGVVNVANPFRLLVKLS